MTNNNKRWTGKSRGGAFGYSFFIHCVKIFGIRTSYAFMSLIMLTVWNTSVRDALQLFTTSAPWTKVLPLPSTANPTDEKFMFDML